MMYIPEKNKATSEKWHEVTDKFDHITGERVYVNYEKRQIAYVDVFNENINTKFIDTKN